MLKTQQEMEDFKKKEASDMLLQRTMSLNHGNSQL